MTISNERARDMARPTRVLVAALIMLALGNAAALASYDSGPSATHDSSSVAGASAVPATSVVPPPIAAPAPAAAPAPKSAAPAKKSAQSSAEVAAPTDDVERLPIMSEGYRYEVELTPTCGRAGQLFTATLHLQPHPGSGGDAMAVYADGSYEQPQAFIAKPDGTVTYSWVGKPIVGEGRLVTGAMNGETGEQGTKILAFRIVDGQTSC